MTINVIILTTVVYTLKEALAKSRPQMDVVSTLETENVTLTKKYNKAKKLIKDLQLRFVLNLLFTIQLYKFTSLSCLGVSLYIYQ